MYQKNELSTSRLSNIKALQTDRSTHRQMQPKELPGHIYLVTIYHYYYYYYHHHHHIIIFIESYQNATTQINSSVYTTYVSQNHYCRVADFLANVNSCSCSLYVVVRPSVCLSVVCNVRAPYSDYWNFRQCFYAIWYLGHLWPFGKNFTEIVSGEPLRRRVKPKRGSKI